MGCEVPCVTHHQLPAMSHRVTSHCNNAFVKHVQINFYAAANLARGVLLAALTQYALHHGVEAAVYNLGYSCRHHLASGHTATALCLIRDNAPLLAIPTFFVTRGRSLRYAFLIKSIKEYTITI